MFRLGFCLMTVVFCSFIVLGQGDATAQNLLPIPKNADPVSTPQPPSSKAEAPQTEKAETIVKPESPTPTPEQPTSKPDEPTTSTAAPTSKPTDPPTPVPTDPPAPKPTPAPAPKPIPPPEQGKWSYTDNNNVTCILLQFAAQLNVTYTNTTSSLEYVLLNVPANATVSGGNCTGADQWLVLSWPASSNITNNMTLAFHLNHTTNNYELKSLNVSLAAEELPDSQEQESVELWHGAEWQTPLSTSYRCAARSQLNMTADVKNVAATLALAQLQEEAFRTPAAKGFSAPRECGGGDVPDAVPIAVGCALGGLVVVMLVAYLVGRRRSAANGYLSM